MKICVTGASGFIGRHLVAALVKKGYSIRILTRQNNVIYPPNVEIIIGDLTQKNFSLNGFISDCDILFHCAGAITDVNTMRLLHVDGTKRLIQAAIAEGSRLDKKIHWIQLSSCGAYGPPNGKPQLDRVVSESTPHKPVNEYELTKTLSDNLLIEACKNNQMSFSILRPSNVFGANMPNQTLRKLINIVKRERFFYLGKPGAIATYVHVDDVVNALLSLAENPRAKNEIYNLSCDCTLEDLINTIANQTGAKKPTLRIPFPLIKIPFSLVSTLLKKWIPVPKIDALVLRTHYPTKKIETELNFAFSQSMPQAIETLIRENELP